MKTLKITLIAMGICALSSCKETNKKDAEKNKYAAETPDYNMDNSADDKLVDDNATTNDEYLTLNMDTMNPMYEDLNMTKDQIDRFKADYNKRISEMRKNNHWSSSDDQLQQEKDESLKSVLSSEQYAKYEKWKKEHPNG